MPLYEYECKKCHHRFEKIQKFSARHTKKCPDCGGPVEQVISAPAVQFKGAGWYVNDYPKKPAAGTSSGESGAKSDSDAGGKEAASKDGGAAKKKEEKPKSESKKK
jgi:putative FmdB family regulatory protein